MRVNMHTRPRRGKAILVYGLLFLIPAGVVFVLVLQNFEGLPLRHSTEMSFIVDPHLSPVDAGTGSSNPVSGTLTVDVQSIDTEIKSRQRMQEALKDLKIYLAKKTEEKQQLFLEQIIENLRVKVEREPGGQNAFLVRLILTLPVEDPGHIEELTRRIRQVYMKYNIKKLIIKAREEYKVLQSQETFLEMEHEKEQKKLKTFLDKEQYTQFLGDPPPIVKRITELQKKLELLNRSTSLDAEKERINYQNRIKNLEDQQKDGPSVRRDHGRLQQLCEKAFESLKEKKNNLKESRAYRDFLLLKSDTRFKIVDKPVSRPVESEQSSRLLLATALGIMAGLVVVLLGLLFGILGGE